MKKIIFLTLLSLCLMPLLTKAETKQIDMYLFHSESCPHCREEIEYLEEYIKTNQDIKLNLYEITKNEDNYNLLRNVQEVMNNYSNSIPFLIIGNQDLVGFSDWTKLRIENIVNNYRLGEYKDFVKAIIAGKLTKEEYENIKNNYEVKEDENNFYVPGFGKVNPKKVSLPLISLTIGLLDGFNPCAMWVLIFLLTCLINSKNKKRMWILGLAFILASSLVYILFMFFWLNIAVSITSIKWIRIAIGLFALGSAIFNFNTFNKERKKDVGCIVTTDKSQKKLIAQIKKWTSEKSFLLCLIGVVTLAVSVNLIELACSAGLPLLWTQIIALNNLNTLTTAVYMGIYMIAFMLDDIIIFVIAMLTLKVTGISNKWTKWTHLIGGLIMLLIGLLLIFKPTWIMFNF